MRSECVWVEMNDVDYKMRLRWMDGWMEWRHSCLSFVPLHFADCYIFS